MNTITIITPTTGKSSLNKLCKSILAQEVEGLNSVHILLWDDIREGYIADFPDILEGQHQRYSIVIPNKLVQEKATGSALRAIGLMAASTDWVTFADDDVWYHKKHLWVFNELMKNSVDIGWGYCRRKIWDKEGNYLGVDNFESIGSDIEDEHIAYEMVDNNCMVFSRQLGSGGAVLYRETKGYNDDRLMYNHLKNYGSIPFITKVATVNQVCPDHMQATFKKYCSI